MVAPVEPAVAGCNPETASCPSEAEGPASFPRNNPSEITAQKIVGASSVSAHCTLGYQSCGEQRKTPLPEQYLRAGVLDTFDRIQSGWQKIDYLPLPSGSIPVFEVSIPLLGGQIYLNIDPRAYLESVGPVVFGPGGSIESGLLRFVGNVGFTRRLNTQSSLPDNKYLGRLQTLRIGDGDVFLGFSVTSRLLKVFKCAWEGYLGKPNAGGEYNLSAAGRKMMGELRQKLADRLERRKRIVRVEENYRTNPLFRDFPHYAEVMQGHLKFADYELRETRAKIAKLEPLVRGTANLKLGQLAQILVEVFDRNSSNPSVSSLHMPDYRLADMEGEFRLRNSLVINPETGEEISLGTIRNRFQKRSTVPDLPDKTQVETSLLVDRAVYQNPAESLEAVIENLEIDLTELSIEKKSPVHAKGTIKWDRLVVNGPRGTNLLHECNAPCNAGQISFYVTRTKDSFEIHVETEGAEVTSRHRKIFLKILPSILDISIGNEGRIMLAGEIPFISHSNKPLNIRKNVEVSLNGRCTLLPEVTDLGYTPIRIGQSGCTDMEFKLDYFDPLPDGKRRNILSLGTGRQRASFEGVFEWNHRFRQQFFSYQGGLKLRAPELGNKYLLTAETIGARPVLRNFVIEGDWDGNIEAKLQKASAGIVRSVLQSALFRNNTTTSRFYAENVLATLTGDGKLRLVSAGKGDRPFLTAKSTGSLVLSPVFNLFDGAALSTVSPGANHPFSFDQKNTSFSPGGPQFPLDEGLLKAWEVTYDQATKNIHFGKAFLRLVSVITPDQYSNLFPFPISFQDGTGIFPQSFRWVMETGDFELSRGIVKFNKGYIGIESTEKAVVVEKPELPPKPVVMLDPVIPKIRPIVPEKPFLVMPDTTDLAASFFGIIKRINTSRIVIPVKEPYLDLFHLGKLGLGLHLPPLANWILDVETQPKALMSGEQFYTFNLGLDQKAIRCLGVGSYPYCTEIPFGLSLVPDDNSLTGTLFVKLGLGFQPPPETILPKFHLTFNQAETLGLRFENRRLHLPLEMEKWPPLIHALFDASTVSGPALKGGVEAPSDSEVAAEESPSPIASLFDFEKMSGRLDLVFRDGEYEVCSGVQGPHSHVRIAMDTKHVAVRREGPDDVIKILSASNGEPLNGTLQIHQIDLLLNRSHPRRQDFVRLLPPNSPLGIPALALENLQFNHPRLDRAAGKLSSDYTLDTLFIKGLAGDWTGTVWDIKGSNISLTHPLSIDVFHPDKIQVPVARLQFDNIKWNFEFTRDGNIFKGTPRIRNFYLASYPDHYEFGYENLIDDHFEFANNDFELRNVDYAATNGKMATPLGSDLTSEVLGRIGDVTVKAGGQALIAQDNLELTRQSRLSGLNFHLDDKGTSVSADQVDFHVRGVTIELLKLLGLPSDVEIRPTLGEIHVQGVLGDSRIEDDDLVRYQGDLRFTAKDGQIEWQIGREGDLFWSRGKSNMDLEVGSFRRFEKADGLIDKVELSDLKLNLIHPEGTVSLLKMLTLDMKPKEEKSFANFAVKHAVIERTRGENGGEPDLTIRLDGVAFDVNGKIGKAFIGFANGLGFKLTYSDLDEHLHFEGSLVATKHQGQWRFFPVTHEFKAGANFSGATLR